MQFFMLQRMVAVVLPNLRVSELLTENLELFAVKLDFSMHVYSEVLSYFSFPLICCMGSTCIIF